MYQPLKQRKCDSSQPQWKQRPDHPTLALATFYNHRRQICNQRQRFLRCPARLYSCTAKQWRGARESQRNSMPHVCIEAWQLHVNQKAAGHHGLRTADQGVGLVQASKRVELSLAAQGSLLSLPPSTTLALCHPGRSCGLHLRQGSGNCGRLPPPLVYPSGWLWSLRPAGQRCCLLQRSNPHNELARMAFLQAWEC